METNNLFQNWASQNQGNQCPNNNLNYWSGGSNTNQVPPYGGGFINRSSSPNPSNIPVRVVFSPEQIAPQEIPLNGTPALFPLSDGSRIIARSLLGNGLFDERVYVLQSDNPANNQPSEFDQVMMRLGKIEQSLDRVLGDLYGTKAQNDQEGAVNKNE